MKLVNIENFYINKEKIIAVYERPVSLTQLDEKITVIEFEGITAHQNYDGTPYYEQSQITTEIPLEEIIKLINS